MSMVIQSGSMTGILCSCFAFSVIMNEIGERVPIWNNDISGGDLMGFYPADSAITAGMCMANRGGSGDIACLGAADRMEMIAYAQLSSRLSGGIVLIIASFVFSFILYRHHLRRTDDPLGTVPMNRPGQGSFGPLLPHILPFHGTNPTGEPPGLCIRAWVVY